MFTVSVTITDADDNPVESFSRDCPDYQVTCSATGLSVSTTVTRGRNTPSGNGIGGILSQIARRPADEPDTV